MCIQENRYHPRVRPDDKIKVTMYSDSEGLKNGHLQDISLSGAFLWGCYVHDTSTKVVFQLSGKRPITKNCNVIRRDYRDQHWVAVKFDPMISLFELSRIAGVNPDVYWPGEQATYDFAKLDRAEVSRETQQIKTCSSTVFLWAMGLILPLTLGIWALAIEGHLNVKSTSSAMIAMLGIFLVAVLSNIEKARAINKREGFMAALDFYLNKGQGPRDYRGWINLKHCFSECGARRRANICPRGIASHSEDTCRDIGGMRSVALLSAKRIIPSVFDSFISLTSICYAVVFTALLILYCNSLARTWNILLGISIVTTTILFCGGFLASAVVWRYRNIVAGVVLGVLFSLIAGAVFPAHIFIHTISGGSGILLGSLTWFLVRQLIALRAGHNSFETYTHMWFVIFENCIFLPNKTLGKSRKPLNKMDQFKRWLFNYGQD